MGTNGQTFIFCQFFPIPVLAVLLMKKILCEYISILPILAVLIFFGGRVNARMGTNGAALPSPQL